MSLTNYAAYCSGERTYIGHYDLVKQEITPLSFASGTPLSNLYQVIEVGEKNIIPGGPAFEASAVTLLPPISGRDILAVGKNYFDHAKEFNQSGYDSSDKADQPTHPVIFTKRATSIIAHGDTIYPHPGFTESADYEGEIGVIVGKSGFRISEEDAMNYVWGYTIINDMTARERQRDHKQFYIGKSPDSFCPMGPIAVPKEHLPADLAIQTHVNGEKRQSATLKDLIFTIPRLIKTLSEGQTLQLGDVLATGTPAGVGFGFRPMKWLHPGDEIRVSVTGLGELVNKIADYDSVNPSVVRIQSITHVPTANNRTFGKELIHVNGKKLFCQSTGKNDSDTVVFIHGLGMSSEYFTPLTQRMKSDRSSIAVDLEGHGMSPTAATSILSISSFAKDIAGVFQVFGLTQGTTVIAHSMGCLVSIRLALDNPKLVKKLVLMGPPSSPLSEAEAKARYERAATVRESGMVGVVDAVVDTGLSEYTKSDQPLAVAAVRLALLGQDPEGYAKACTALAASEGLDLSQIQCPTLIITGTDDYASPPQLCHSYSEQIPESQVHVLDKVGHYHLFESPHETMEVVAKFLS